MLGSCEASSGGSEKSGERLMSSGDVSLFNEYVACRMRVASDEDVNQESEECVDEASGL